MTEFWESSFRDKQAMWGFEPADSAVETSQSFKQLGLKKILIPGFGYGRNAQVFMDSGFEITGIEISETAIELARKHYGDQVKIHHGPVNDMPFDNQVYDGIFCYALIHLLDHQDRLKLIDDCYRQLKPNGYMVFVALSKNTATYGEGLPIGPDQFESKHGVKLFYYGPESINQEFGSYGLLETKEIDEPAKNMPNKPSQKFWQITCRKKAE